MAAELLRQGYSIDAGCSSAFDVEIDRAIQPLGFDNRYQWKSTVSQNLYDK